MNGIVVGGGSIGKRHLRNLKALGVGCLGLVEPANERRNALATEVDAAQFAILSEGIQSSPDFVVVATPPHLHVQQALEVARHGCDLFIEKPLSHSRQGLAELSDAVERQSLVSMVGCNMRFHPGPVKVKELIQQNLIGKILFARIHVGSYLPEWRPGSDYRDNYAAREETGGGCILDCIHEIDLARWYLGEVREVFCSAGHLSSLEISTEDVAVLLCRHTNSALSEIHLDYVQRTYERGCQIVGENGSIFWDSNSRQVRCYQAATQEWTTYSQAPGWQLNDMYLDEMRHFLDCVRTRSETICPVTDTVSVMRIVFAARDSARLGRFFDTGNGEP